MNCSKCEFDNVPDATHCESCGEQLIVQMADPSATEQVSEKQEEKPAFLPVENDLSVGTTTEKKEAEYPNTVVPDLSGNKKTGKGTRFVVTAVVIALALVAGLGFMFRNKILKTISPERYLQVSLSRTFSDKKYSKIIDMSKYDKKPVKCEMSVEAEGVGAEGSLMYDAKGEKALFEAVLDDGTKVYDENLLYISRELIAISIPEILTDVEFLTIDPATFADDLKKLGVEQSVPSEYMDQALDMFFGKTENGEADMDEMTEYYREAKFLEEYADFSKGESITEEINGKSYKLDAMCYEISEKDANQQLQDFFEGYKEGYMNSLESMYQGYSLEMSQEDMEAALDIFDDIRIDGDIKITYYVDSNDYVRKIVLDEFELKMNDSEGKIAIEFEMLLGGKKNPTDNISAVLTLSAEGEEVELCMNWDESLEDGVFQGELELFIEGNGNTEDMGATIEIEWDANEKEDENFKAKLTIDGLEGFGIEVIGTLIDGKTSTTFTDGQFIIVDEYRNENVVEFDFSISIIDPKDISIDMDDSMPLVDYVEQQSTAYSGNI